MTALPNNSVGITPEEQQAVVKERLQQMGVPLTDPVSLMPGQPVGVQANSPMEVPDTAVGTDLDDVQQNTKAAKAAVDEIMAGLQQPGLTPEQNQAANRELTKRRGEFLRSARTQADLASPKTIDPRKHANQDMLPGEVWRNPNRGAEQQRIVILPGTGQMVMVDKDTGWSVQLTGDQAKLAIASADVARGQQIKQEEADNARVAYTRDSEALQYAIQLNGQTNDVLLDSRFSGLDAVAGYDPELADDLAEFYKSAQDFVHSMSPQEYEDFLVSGESHLQQIHSGKYDTDTGGLTEQQIYDRKQDDLDAQKGLRIEQRIAEKDRRDNQTLIFKHQADANDGLIKNGRENLNALSVGLQEQVELRDALELEHGTEDDFGGKINNWNKLVDVRKEIKRLTDLKNEAKRNLDLAVQRQNGLILDLEATAGPDHELDLNQVAEQSPDNAFSRYGPFAKIIEAVATRGGFKGSMDPEFLKWLTSNPENYAAFVKECQSYAQYEAYKDNPGDESHWMTAIDENIVFTEQLAAGVAAGKHYMQQLQQQQQQQQEGQNTGGEAIVTREHLGTGQKSEVSVPLSEISWEEWAGAQQQPAGQPPAGQQPEGQQPAEPEAIALAGEVRSDAGLMEYFKGLPDDRVYKYMSREPSQTTGEQDAFVGNKDDEVNAIMAQLIGDKKFLGWAQAKGLDSKAIQSMVEYQVWGHTID